MSLFKTGLLLAGLTALFGVVGLMIGGQGGMVIALLLAAGMNLFAWWGSDSLALRAHRAQPLSETEAPDLYGMTRTLSERAGIPMPRLYLIESDQPNAFATGRNPSKGALAVTRGLLNGLNGEEVAGVLAHEIAHIKNRDTLIMTVTATIAGAISMLANFAFFFGGNRDSRSPLGGIGMLAVALLAPIGAMLVQLAISRTREYEADREGATISGQPLWLASALERIHAAAARIENPLAERNPATAHLFIANPLHGHGADNLFATHPSLANRVARLRAMAGAQGQPRGPWG